MNNDHINVLYIASHCTYNTHALDFSDQFSAGQYGIMLSDQKISVFILNVLLICESWMGEKKIFLTSRMF